MLQQKEFNILSVIEEQNTKLSQREIAKLTNLSIGTVNSTIAKLEENNLINIDNNMDEDRFNKMAVYCKGLENRIKELEESKKELTNEITKINDRLNKMALVVKEIQTQNKQQNSLNEVKAIQQQHKQQKQQQQQVQESKKDNNQIPHNNTNFMVDIRKSKTDEEILEVHPEMEDFIQPDILVLEEPEWNNVAFSNISFSITN
jgi:DNA-binding MarR family transcriptional regulator